MTFDAVENFSMVTVSGSYDSEDLTIQLEDNEGSKLPESGVFDLTWWNSTDYSNPADDPGKEIVRVTEVNDDEITILRAQQDTGATAKNTSGKTYSMVLSFTKKTYDDFASEINKKIESETDPVFTASEASNFIAGDKDKLDGIEAQFDELLRYNFLLS